MVDEQLVENIELGFLKVVVDLLENGTLELEKAQTIAKQFLALLPFADDAEMETKLKAFTDEHMEFKGVYVTLLRYEDDKRKDVLIKGMRALMKEGKIEEAIQLAK